MARKERITYPGFYHIVNRGVEQRKIFLRDEDYDYFLDIVENLKDKFNISIHAFCLMTNHYHILIKTNEQNISQALKHLNLTYAKYFNYKYKRVGHLWQGRFHSTYLYDDIHCFDVAKYIERNPIKARMVNEIIDYKYQSFYHWKTKGKYFKLLNNSIIFDMTLDEYEKYIKEEFETDIFDLIYKEPNIIKKDGNRKILYKRLKTFFDNDYDINRNINIKKAYDYGYRKSEIANYLNITSNSVVNIL